MTDTISNGLSNLELLYMCKKNCDGSRMTDSSINSFLLAELLERGLVTQGMIISGVDTEKLFADELKREVDAAVSKHYFVSEKNTIELLADEEESNEFLLETVYSERNSIELDATIYQKIFEDFPSMDVSIQEIENDILHEMGVFDTVLEDLSRECFQEHYSIEPPYDYYLNQDMKVNIMLATKEELNNVCGTLYEQYLALSSPGDLTDATAILQMDSGLTYLLKQQGHTMDELIETMDDYNSFFNEEDSLNEVIDADGNLLPLHERIKIFNKTHNNFLTTVCQELECQTYNIGVMTVLARMNINEFIEMQKGNKEIIFGKDATIGIFHPQNKSISLLGIELENDFVVTTDMIRDIQIEGVKPEREYTVGASVEASDRSWTEVKIGDIPQPGKIEVKIDPDRKPTLSDLIAAAEAEKAGATQKENQNKEMVH